MHGRQRSTGDSARDGSIRLGATRTDDHGPVPTVPDATDQDLGPDRGPACPACAHPLGRGARFCATCGRSVETSDGGSPPVTVGRQSTEVATAPATAPVTAPATAPATAQEAGATGVMASRATSADTVRDDLWTWDASSRRSGTVHCPVCGAGNDAERQLCGACGIDLATGDPQLTVAPAPAEHPTSGPGTPLADDGRTHPVPWRLPVLAGLVVLALVAAAIVGLGLGPFAAETELPPADFVATSYPGQPAPLGLSDVATLTVQGPVGTRSFTPGHLVDGDPRTAWHGAHDALPADTDEKIDLFLDEPAWVTAMVIDNGDHLDAEAYAATSRVQRAMVIFDGDVRVPVTLLDQGIAPQIVEFEEPLLSAGVRIEILDTVAGTDADEVALTRLELLGFTARGEDVSLAERRAALLPAAGAITLPA